MRTLDELGLAEADLFALAHDLPEQALRERHGTLDELGLREADLASLARDAPERSVYRQELDAELREEERERSVRVSRPRTFRWDGPTTDEPDGPALMSRLSESQRRELERVVEETDGARPGGTRLSERATRRRRTRPGDDLAGWIATLRDPDRRGGPVPWQRVREIVTPAFDSAEVEAAAQSIRVREEAAARAYRGEPSEQELADREAAFDEAWGEDGEALIEELAEGLRGG